MSAHPIETIGEFKLAWDAETLAVRAQRVLPGGGRIIGRCRPPAKGAGGLTIPPDWDAVKALFPGIEVWEAPYLDGPQEIITLIFNKTRNPPCGNRLTKLTPRVETRVFERMAEPAYSFASLFSDPEELVLTEIAFRKFLADIQDDRSPGLPYGWVYSTNGALKANACGALKLALELRLRRLRKIGELVIHRGSAPKTLDAALKQYLMEKGLVDPVRVFAKNEPHTSRKPGRNISSVSVLDSLVERVLYAGVLEAQVANWKELDATIGIDLDTPEETERFRQSVMASIPPGRVMVSNDVRGFEFNYDAESESVFLANMIELNGAEWKTSDTFSCVAAGRSFCALHPTFVLSNGSVVTYDTPHQLSGRFVTTLSNSVDRLDRIDRVRASIKGYNNGEWHPRSVVSLSRERSFVNGDDSLELSPGSEALFVHAYARNGLTVTDYHEFSQGGDFVFCSHVFTPNGVYPENPLKLIAKFMMGRRGPEQLASLKGSLSRIPGQSLLKKVDGFIHQ